MPMKEKSGGDKKKPGKKAKLKKEEAERKAREEEEARIRAEKEEEERKERELCAAEELRFLETEEKKRRKGELTELDAILTNNYNKLFAAKLDARKHATWARYMRCDGSPDPSILGEINTYLTVWREDTKNIEFEMICKEADVALELITELEYHLDDTMDTDMTDAKRTQYKETIRALQNIINEKLDLATHDLMLKATGLALPDQNLIRIIGNDVITLCLWANLTKNPRTKSFDFDSKGMVFELNPALNRANCAVRALFTKFDHLSHLSKSFYPRLKVKPLHTLTSSTENLAMETTDISDDQKENSPHQPGVELQKDAHSAAAKPSVQSHASDVEEELSERATEETSKPEGDQLNDESAEEDDIALATPEPPDFEDFDGDNDVIDLRGFQVVGGVVHINLCELPPQPKSANKWMITLLVDPPELHHIDYVAGKEQKAEESALPVGDTPSKESLKIDKKDKDTEKMTPIMVTLRLPENVCFCEEPQVARWSYEESVWRTDGILDKVYNEVGRQLTFRICRFGSMALLQDSHINMPFQSWELRPRQTNHAQLTIIAAILEVEIQIKNDLVCLSQPENKPELTHLINKWLSTRDFVKRMRESGVNLFPAEDSFKYVKIPDKNPVTEDCLYRQMSLVSSAMAFSWSRWNADVNDRRKIIFQGAQHLNDEPLLEEDWSLFQVTKRRTMKLKMNEFSETFSGDHAEGSQFYADLYHMTMDTVSETAKERIHDTSAEFSETVYSLLHLTRVIPYS